MINKAVSFRRWALSTIYLPFGRIIISYTKSFYRQFQWENTDDFSGRIQTISVGEYKQFQWEQTDRFSERTWMISVGEHGQIERGNMDDFSGRTQMISLGEHG